MTENTNNVIATINNAVQSPIGQAAVNELKALGMAHADALVEGFIKIELAENPGLSVADLTAKVDGDVKHAVRAKIGWLVDFIWAVEDNNISAYISGLVAAATVTETTPEQSTPEPEA